MFLQNTKGTSILTKHFLQVCHPQKVWALVVEERDPLFVVWRQAWYLAPFQTAIPVESPHFADPYFLGAVDKTPVYPAGHSIQLKTKIGTTYNVEHCLQRNVHKQSTS